MMTDEMNSLCNAALAALANPAKSKKNEIPSSYTCPYCIKSYAPNTHDIHVLEKDRKLVIKCNRCNRRYIIFL